MPEDPLPGGWSEHARERRRAWLRLTPERRLELLEQLKAFCQEGLGAAHPRIREKLLARARAKRQ
ncbi:MAG: hypothetical protein HYZ28_02330 [Myxococcales bacterium]|nr:hypothetical protein [Myxococcales bacterium]